VARAVQLWPSGPRVADGTLAVAREARGGGDSVAGLRSPGTLLVVPRFPDLSVRLALFAQRLTASLIPSVGGIWTARAAPGKPMHALVAFLFSLRPAPHGSFAPAATCRNARAFGVASR
jgi:hypothetical protein